MKLTFICFLLFLLATHTVFAQNPQQQARVLSRQGMAALDSGDIASAMKLLKQAQQLDTANIHYKYQIATACFLNKDFKQVVKLLRPLMTHRDISPNMIRLLANTYDNLGQQDKAIELYHEGIKLSPHDGKFYCDLGNIYLMKKQREQALNFFETGLFEDTKFIPNYYWAAKTHLAAGNLWWGLLYGEIFTNLERNSQRTYEISRLLYEGYQKLLVQSSNDSLWRVKVPEGTFQTTFEKDCEHILQQIILPNKGTQIEKIVLLRQKFVQLWLDTPTLRAKMPYLVLYWSQIYEEDYTASYVHWLLNQGNEEEFEQWTDHNVPEFSRFITWFVEHPLEVGGKKIAKRALN